MPKVLIVEGDRSSRQGMARHLRAATFDPIRAGNGRTALARLRYEHAEVCVLDLMLPEPIHTRYGSEPEPREPVR